MKLFNAMLLYYGFISGIVVSQNLIRDLSEEQYFHAVFNNTHDHIFPRDLKLELQLTRNVGLLFYSIDKNLNQLIVNIIDSNEPIMKIEFRNQDYFIKLKDFCNCRYHSCLYEKLNFQFQIDSEIVIRCNIGTIITYKFSNNKSLKNDYPIPSFLTGNISAFLWIINISKYKNGDSIVYPVVDYLNGCVYDVTYDSKVIKLNLNGPIEKCKNYCKPGICNGGQCLETFELQPVCDCNETFYNGNYCNQSLSGCGIHSYKFQFNVMKLTWNCIGNQILKVTSKFKSIDIFLNSTKLNLKYQNDNISETIPIIDYKENCSYIMFLTLINKSIEIQIKSEKQHWIKHFIYVGQDLSQECFTKIRVLGNSCEKADVVYKLSNDEISWIPVKFREYLKWKIYKSKIISTVKISTHETVTNTNEIKGTIIYTLPIILIVSILSIVLLLLLLHGIINIYITQKRLIKQYDTIKALL